MAFTYFLPDENGNKTEHGTTSNAVIIIGANGSGKSKLGAWIEQQDMEQIHRNNQVILTTTLKHEELGKYDSIEGVNHINYISHIPSKILDGRYVADFLGLLSALSIKVQS